MSDKNPCENCSLCCRYVALEIDTPEDKKDIDQIKWFLLHKDVWVYLDHDNSWNLQFNTPCEKLDGHICSIHPLKLGTKEDLRPQICGDYSTDSCEKYGEGQGFKTLWKNMDEFNLWLKENEENLLK